MRISDWSSDVCSSDLIDWTMRRPKTVLLIAGLVFATTAWPLTRLGGEFMPNLDEGDLLYMPSALPGLSAAKASQLLQQTDRLIKTVPEVESVFRSEEHTSEIQSLMRISYAVFCLKNNKTNNI